MAVRAERLRNATSTLDQLITLSAPLPENLSLRQDLIARIGGKTVGVAEMPFVPVHRISL